MTISSTTYRNDYTATAGQVDFPYTFKILDTSELTVYCDGTLKTETTDYTVSGEGEAAGGNVTFLAAPGAGVAVAIIDVPSLTQETAYIQNDAFNASTHENALDKLTRIALYLKGLISQSVLLPIYSTLTDLTLPTPVADEFLKWNSTATGLESIGIGSISGVAYSAFGASLIDDADSSTAQTTLGVSDFMKEMLDDTTSSAAQTTLGISTFAKTLLDDTTSAAARSTLGVSSSFRSYLTGLGLSNATDTDHDITIAAGECVDSTNTYDMALSSAITKQIDATWAAGTGNGGLFTGTVANTTWYHVHLIRKDDDGTIDAGFDTSVTAANKPAGYSYYRRIGSVLSDGSANLLQFYQYGDDFMWATPVLDVNSTNPGTNAISVTLSTPLGVVTKAMLNVATDNPAANENRSVYLSTLSSPVSNMAASNSAAPLGVSGLYNATTTQVSGNAFVHTNTSSQIRLRCYYTTAGFIVRLATLGWIDRRGRDD